MNKLKFSKYIITLFLLLALGCSTDKNNNDNSGTQEPEPALDVGTVETNGGSELCGGIAGLEADHQLLVFRCEFGAALAEIINSAVGQSLGGASRGASLARACSDNSTTSTA